jgi:hypothetical protein
LAILTDPQSFEAEAMQKNRLTDTDWLAWKLISGRLSA